MRNQKPETRNQKSERLRRAGNPKAEIRRKSDQRLGILSGFGLWSFIRISGFGFLVSAVVGCGDNHPSSQPPAPELMAASQALANHQPEQVIFNARQFLENQPTGPEAAQALYFEGRGHQELNASNLNDRNRNLEDARRCYLLAIQQSPAPKLEADIHIGIAIVDYQLDNFADCIQEASVAMQMTSSNDLKGNLLLYTGMSQQRLGRFTDADQTYRQVEQRYAGTPMADRARMNEGRSKFFVQLPPAPSQDAADRAAQSLRGRNLVVSQSTDAGGHTVIDVGSYETYPQAKTVLDQLHGEFPNAEIVP
jgi:tetratricopeptide (TPR) repeat protein